MKRKKSYFFQNFQFFDIFLTLYTHFALSIFLLKSYFQELILSQHELQYKIQFLRKHQLEIIYQNSTIDFFSHAKSPFFGRPCLSKKLATVKCSQQQEEFSALRANTNFLAPLLEQEASHCEVLLAARRNFCAQSFAQAYRRNFCA